METFGPAYPATLDVDRAERIANWQPIVQWLPPLGQQRRPGGRSEREAVPADGEHAAVVVAPLPLDEAQEPIEHLALVPLGLLDGMQVQGYRTVQQWHATSTVTSNRWGARFDSLGLLLVPWVRAIGPHPRS
jgi:hypothetical protein